MRPSLERRWAVHDHARTQDRRLLEGEEGEPVPASGSVEVVTPIRLRFRAGAPPSSGRFVWSIAHAPGGVELTFTLDLPPPFDQPCQAQVAPGSR
jgi:hypothetical protein